jgi:hypothetical protein
MIRRRRARSNQQVQFDPPLPDPHGLMLHQSERGRVTLLGSAATVLSASTSHSHSRSSSSSRVFKWSPPRRGRPVVAQPLAGRQALCVIPQADAERAKVRYTFVNVSVQRWNEEAAASIRGDEPLRREPNKLLIRGHAEEALMPASWRASTRSANRHPLSIRNSDKSWHIEYQPSTVSGQRRSRTICARSIRAATRRGTAAPRAMQSRNDSRRCEIRTSANADGRPRR